MIGGRWLWPWTCAMCGRQFGFLAPAGATVRTTSHGAVVGRWCLRCFQDFQVWAATEAYHGRLPVTPPELEEGR